MKNILLVDDDIAIGSLLSIALQEQGFDVHYQSTMFNVLEVIKETKPNLIILDVEVGEDNSINSLPDIIKVSNSAPIIFISSHHESELIVDAISSGGLIYLKKPFNPSELIVYAKKFCNDKPSNKIIEFGNCTLFINERNLKVPDNNSAIIKLGRKELNVLRTLIEGEGEVVNRDKIIASAFDVNIVSEHSINNIICHLRQYLSSDKSITIKTIHGSGYSLHVEKETKH